MPGPYVHISSMWHTAERFEAGNYRPVPSPRVDPTFPGAPVTELARLMRENPNFAAVGAVGPDLFFFLPDFRNYHGIPVASVLIGVLDSLEAIYEKLDPYISKWEHYLGPITENTAEALSRLTGGLSESVGRITGELTSILLTSLADQASFAHDWWGFFSLGLDKGYDEQAYLWSDMLHYRDTGRFGRTLWEKARSRDEGARAYALGYLTHLATDVTGHAFVNKISGGPFRTHWQRHHLVENHMDADWYLLDDASQAPRRKAGYGQWTDSALYYNIAFDEGNGDKPISRPAVSTGRSLRESWERRRKLDVDSKLPDTVTQLLLDTIEDVFYTGESHPLILKTPSGRPTAKLIEEAYDLLFRYLKFSSVDGIDHEIPPPPDVFPNLDFPTMSDPAGDSPPDDSPDFWDDVLDFLLAVVAVLLYIVDVAVWIATIPWAVLADVVTFPLRLGAYYALELPLFHLLKQFRSVLVMTAYLHPQKDEISQALVRVGNPIATTWSQVLDEVGDTFGGMLPDAPPPSDVPFRDEEYPHRHDEHEHRHPWNYPNTSAERTPTTAGPAPLNAGPSSLFTPLRQDADIRDRLESAETPDQADRVGRDVSPARHMGDAVTFSEYVLWLATRESPPPPPPINAPDVPGRPSTRKIARALDSPVEMVDWNLDADRGYGYHCWDWNRMTSQTAPDPNGHRFGVPCVWPPQSADDQAVPGAKVDPTLPLQLHWKSGPDPGCAQGGPPNTGPNRRDLAKRQGSSKPSGSAS